MTILKSMKPKGWDMTFLVKPLWMSGQRSCLWDRDIWAETWTVWQSPSSNARGQHFQEEGTAAGIKAVSSVPRRGGKAMWVSPVRRGQSEGGGRRWACVLLPKATLDVNGCGRVLGLHLLQRGILLKIDLAVLICFGEGLTWRRHHLANSR